MKENAKQSSNQVERTHLFKASDCASCSSAGKLSSLNWDLVQFENYTVPISCRNRNPSPRLIWVRSIWQILRKKWHQRPLEIRPTSQQHFLCYQFERVVRPTHYISIARVSPTVHPNIVFWAKDLENGESQTRLVTWPCVEGLVSFGSLTL